MMEWRAGHGVTVFERERSAFSRTKILDFERSGANISRAIGENGSSLPIPEKCFERVKRMEFDDTLAVFSRGISNSTVRIEDFPRGTNRQPLLEHREQLRNLLLSAQSAEAHNQVR